MKTKFLLILGICVWGYATAQKSVRVDDQFYKRLVVQRMDMEEKINRPFQGILRHPSDQAGSNGLVQTLLTGLKEGKIHAYHPDDITKVLSYEDVIQRMREFEQALTGEIEAMDTVDVPDWEEDLFEDEDDFITGDDLDTDFDEGEADPLNDLANYESVVQWTEEWIFDKNRGEMIRQIQHLQLIWTDPGGSIMEKYLAIFQYNEATDVLADARWHNRHNDAAHLNLKQALDMRLFNAYIINVSGKGVQSLAEAELRRLQLVEYEHHLWCY